MRVLPDNLRDILKAPIGQLVDEKGLLKLIRDEKYIVSIGDLVTYTILKNEIEPFFCIVDYKTRRGSCSEEIIDLIKSFGKKTILVKNPPATITDDLWNIIEIAYENLKNESLRIEVEGEEDLASLAAIYLAPPDVTIIYGLPDKGVLVVKPTDYNKRKVKEILDKM
jgi:GTP-dependent dephospho-CoA kinase